MLLAIVLRLRFIPTRVGQMAGASCCCTVLMVGSSPRVWGRFVVTPFNLAAIMRFIPTRVGQMNPTFDTRSTINRFIPTRVGQMNI